MKKKTTIKRHPTKKKILVPQLNKLYHQNLPVYCDLYCPYASFTDTCLSGACHRETAIYCKLFKRYNHKHARCFVKKIN